MEYWGYKNGILGQNNLKRHKKVTKLQKRFIVIFRRYRNGTVG